MFFEVDTEKRTLCRGEMSVRWGTCGREGLMMKKGFDAKDLTMGGSLR